MTPKKLQLLESPLVYSNWLSQLQKPRLITVHKKPSTRRAMDRPKTALWLTPQRKSIKLSQETELMAQGQALLQHQPSAKSPYLCYRTSIRSNKTSKTKFKPMLRPYRKYKSFLDYSGYQAQRMQELIDRTF